MAGTGYAALVASTHPAPPADRNGRLTLAAVTFAGLFMLVWLIVSLAASAF